MVMQSRGIVISGIAAVIALSSRVDSAWNLPYPQPAKYNYSSSYSADLSAYLAADSSYLKTSLSKGWTYYKAHYLMSNGLVNHMQGQNVGTNEAVSEGQGYGMLLALLNNDQATFNTIFAAANSFLWDNGRKSYNWQYINGSISAGAAADADLDIGLALVFADELRKKGYWNTYSVGGITYQSRAMDIIRTIRSKMCSNDYLLPGDNWGGDAINNLNPSYFATAWLKVFNAYQTEVNFDAVVTKCYQVLKTRSTQYAKGQAPDWCTSNGGQASQRPSLAMGNDAIRTPWRIAMDALWFNDSRAIEFCANSRNTLTKYTDPSKNFVMAQMCQYDQSGNVNASTCGSFSEVAMWCSGVMGSKDTAYTRKVVTPVTAGRIVGQYDCFGDKSMSDHLYYYKQSIGMLGFAAIGGQFPNVLEDMRSNPVMGTASVGIANHVVGDIRCRMVFGGVLISMGREDGVPVHAKLFSASGREVLSGRIVPAQTSEGNRRTFFFSTARYIKTGVVGLRIATSDGKVIYSRQMPLANTVTQ